MGKAKARHPSPPVCELRAEMLEDGAAVWRVVRLSSGVLLPRLHRVLLAALGWFRADEWWFEAAAVRYGEPNEQDARADAATVRLRHLLPDIGHELRYGITRDRATYAHRLTIDRLLSPDPNLRDPVCLAGAGTVPTASARATGFDVRVTNAELQRLR